MKVKIKRWNSVAYWRWDVSNEEVCGICRNLFDGCCPTCSSDDSDDCPLICGECTHVFHMHCLLKWLQTEGSRGMCPMDRGTWGNPPSPVDHIIYDDLQEIRIIKNDPNSIVNDQSDGIDKDGNEDYIEEYVGEEYEKGGNSGDNKSYVIERIEEGELKTQQDVGVVGSCGGFDEEAQSEQTFRKRKTKNYYEKPKVIKDLEWLKFREWLNQQGFPKTKLTLAEFKGTGRARRNYNISSPKISNNISKSDDNIWRKDFKNYDYDNGNYNDVMKYLPYHIKDLLENQRKKFIDDFKVVNKFLEKNADLSMPITYDEFLWGWLNEAALIAETNDLEELINNYYFTNLEFGNEDKEYNVEDGTVGGELTKVSDEDQLSKLLSSETKQTLSQHIFHSVELTEQIQKMMKDFIKSYKDLSYNFNPVSMLPIDYPCKKTSLDNSCLIMTAYELFQGLNSNDVVASSLCDRLEKITILGIQVIGCHTSVFASDLIKEKILEMTTNMKDEIDSLSIVNIINTNTNNPSAMSTTTYSPPRR
ncbi:8759_t:CDS:10 [Entrophospora sp. SA101]|nr:8759_t:CDS:10 [Entrophospora sp. SA101]